LLAHDDLGSVDPLAMNLVVVKGIPSLADLDIGHYVALADAWAAEIRRCLPEADANFDRQPELWQNDRDFGRLALMCWYVSDVLKTRYREDQKRIARILYTNPGDLFLHGVMDSRQGTCGNMAALHVALGWRMGWPVSLACVGSHFICRFDDGHKTFNIEATNPGEDGTFSSPPDYHYMQQHNIPQRGVDCGSDLRAVTPRELLGLFVGARARHFENTERFAEAEQDYLLARHLFPNNRCLYIAQNQISVQNSMELFEPGEKGHPTELAEWLQEVVFRAPWRGRVNGKPNGHAVEVAFQHFVGGF
jgi:hypothetical protein